MKRLTKAEIQEGEQGANYWITAQNIKDVREALVEYFRAVKKRDETTAQRIAILLEVFNEEFKLMNPS